MVFSSMTFLFAFLPIALILYYVVPKKFQNLILLITGVFFYAWGEPVYVIIMLIAIVVDYAAGILMEKYDVKQKRRFVILMVSIVINLSFLAVFKYSSFLIGTVNGLFHMKLFNPHLPLPIGISFYTFHAMSYTIDIYRRKIKAQKNLITFAAYFTMFPPLIAGPIVRYSDVAGEMEHRTVDRDMISSGILLFLCGLGKKVLLANNIGAVWTAVKGMDYTTLPSLSAWIGILAFTFQIYFDFSGYTDMALGLGKMLGFHYPQNFEHPYMALSVSDFWRRWHMTLTSWFKSYVYIPLGGNRCSKSKNIRNLAIVWALTGLWHGASWNFVFWGLYFGILIILEKFIWGKGLQKLPAFVQWFYTFFLVVLGWVFFEMKDNSISAIGGFFSALFGFNHAALATNGSFYLIFSNILLLVACAIGATTLPKRFAASFCEKRPVLSSTITIVGGVMLFFVCICYLVTSTYNPFLYFNF